MGFLYKPKIKIKTPNVFILSAKSTQQLRLYAQKLSVYVSDKIILTDGPSVLEKICYTLQTGRIAHQHRLAIQCMSLADLKTKLDAYLHGKYLESIFTGCLEPNKAGLAEHEDNAFVSHCIRSNNLQKLAEEWTSGLIVPWNSLYAQRPQRIGIPGYPFNKESYWIPASDIYEKLYAPLVSRDSKYESILDSFLEGELSLDAAADQIYGQVYHSF